MERILANSSHKKLIFWINSKVLYLSCDVPKNAQLKITMIVHEEAFGGSIMISDEIKYVRCLKISHQKNNIFVYSIFQWMQL